MKKNIILAIFLVSCSPSIKKLEEKTVNKIISNSPSTIQTVFIDKKIKDLSLEIEKKDFEIGDYIPIDAKIIFSDNNFDRMIKITSSDNNIINVNANGIARALKGGKATITATSLDNPKLKKSVEVNVKPLSFFINVFTENNILVASNDPENNREIREYKIEKGAKIKFIVKLKEINDNIKIKNDISILLENDISNIISTKLENTNNINEKVIFVEGVNFGKTNLKIQLNEEKNNFVKFPILFRENIKNLIDKNPECLNIIKSITGREQMSYPSNTNLISYDYIDFNKVFFYPSDNKPVLITAGSEIKESTSSIVKIYDSNRNLIKGKVTARYIENDIIKNFEILDSKDGLYILRFAPIGKNIEFIVEKGVCS
ncbi:MAG: Ig-like domain-containing protein [Candidatus Sericytochromatia bacterium]